MASFQDRVRAEKKTMSCPYLEGENLKRCAAVKRIMVLSVGGLKDYCTTKKSFSKCKFFKGAELDNKEIKETKGRNA